MADEKRDDLDRFHREVQAFIQDLDAETDRAAVILGAARLDGALYDVLAAFLSPSPKKGDDLFEGEGSLSSFSARIDMANRLRLVDDEFARALHLVRRIRNTFAHQVSGVSLENGPEGNRVRELANVFHRWDGMKAMKALVANDGHSEQSRDFRTSLAIMVGRLVRLSQTLRPVPNQAESVLPRREVPFAPRNLREAIHEVIASRGGSPGEASENASGVTTPVNSARTVERDERWSRCGSVYWLANNTVFAAFALSQLNVTESLREWNNAIHHAQQLPIPQSYVMQLRECQGQFREQLGPNGEVRDHAAVLRAVTWLLRLASDMGIFTAAHQNDFAVVDVPHTAT